VVGIIVAIIVAILVALRPTRRSGRTGRVTARSACSAPVTQPLYWAREGVDLLGRTVRRLLHRCVAPEGELRLGLEHLIDLRPRRGLRAGPGRSELVDEHAVVVVDARHVVAEGAQHRHLADTGHRQRPSTTGSA
jgi:hypothetical protein